MKQLVIPALLALLIAGCSSTHDADQVNAPVEDGRGRVATVEAGNVNGSKLPRELTDPQSILSRRSVFFDYDRFDVKDEYRELVIAHACFLSNNRQFKMLLNKLCLKRAAILKGRHLGFYFRANNHR